MANELMERFVQALEAQNRLLGQIGITLDRLAGAGVDPDEGPEFEKGLEAFKDFDWSTINASVLATDEFGATLVEWQGRPWKRRSPENEFGTAIWFSRCVGKDDSGRNLYAKLITFKPTGKVKAISREAERELARTPTRQAPPPAAALPPKSQASQPAGEQVLVDAAIAESDKAFAATGPSQGEALKAARAAAAAAQAGEKAGTPVIQGQLPGTARTAPTGRPMSADQVIAGLRRKAAYGRTHPQEVHINGAYGAAIGCLDAVCPHTTLIKAAFGKASARDLEPEEKWALASWADARKREPGAEGPAWYLPEWIKIEYERVCNTYAPLVD